MANPIDMTLAFLDRGVDGCLYDSIADAICGDCSPPDYCKGCDGTHLITDIEGQIAQAGLEFMKQQRDEWLKYSMN